MYPKLKKRKPPQLKRKSPKNTLEWHGQLESILRKAFSLYEEIPEPGSHCQLAHVTAYAGQRAVFNIEISGVGHHIPFEVVPRDPYKFFVRPLREDFKKVCADDALMEGFALDDPDKGWEWVAELYITMLKYKIFQISGQPEKELVSQAGNDFVWHPLSAEAPGRRAYPKPSADR